MSDARQQLELRLAELVQEVRRYPTPIARCDEQLSALLEERTRVLVALDRLAGPAGDDAPIAARANGGIPYAS